MLLSSLREGGVAEEPQRRVTKWLQITSRDRDPWILRIWGAVNAANECGICGPLPPRLRELGPHLTTRLTMLQRIFHRINEEVATVRRKVANHEARHEFTPEQPDAVAFPLDDDLTYNLLLDLDSLLFEIWSCCELVTRLFAELYAHRGRPLRWPRVGREIRRVLETASHPTRWFESLASHRHFFIHEAAPYVAVDLSDPDRPDLLFTKRNLRSFDDSEEFLRLSEIKAIVEGFEGAKRLIQEHLIALFRDRDGSGGSSSEAP